VIPFAAHAAATLYAAANIADAFKWPGQFRKLTILLGGSAPLSDTWFLGFTRVFSQNGISIGSVVFAQLTVECPIGRYISPNNCLLPLGNQVPHLTHGT